MRDKSLNIIILAAGEGTRLRPYTLECPKCMVEINGESLLDRQISVLDHKSINEIIIIGGYKIGMLEGKGDRLRENKRYHETNMVWTLFSAEEDLQDELIVSYGDIVYSREILQSLLDSNSDISVIIDKDWESYWRARFEDPLDDAETLKLRDNGTILEIGKKPESIEEIEGQYIGLMKFSAKGISQIKEIFQEAKGNGDLLNKSLERAYMTDLLQAAIYKGIEIQSIPVNGGWIEVDSVEDLKSEVTLSRLEMIN